MSVQISSQKIEKASKESMDAFLSVFTDAYLQTLDNKLDNATMGLLNGWQHSLLAYHFFREEIIFRNPFAKSMKIFGAQELSKIVYKAMEIYDTNQNDLERETTDEEFTAMYEQYEAFDELEERFFEIEEDCTSIIASYVDNHIEDFAVIAS